MEHGTHHNCVMCKMARATGMMEKHPEGCKCGEVHPKKEEKEDEQKSESQVRLGESKVSASLGM